MGVVILGDHQQSAGILVDAMDDSRTDNAVDGRKPVFAVKHDRIDQRPRIVSYCRMDYHSLGFVHNQNIVIFIEDVQRDIFRTNLQLLCLRNGNLQ